MIVEVGLVVGVIAPMTPKGAGSVRGQAVVTRDRVRKQIFRAGRFLGDELVLENLVLVTTEARFFVGHAGQ